MVLFAGRKSIVGEEPQAATTATRELRPVLEAQRRLHHGTVGRQTTIIRGRPRDVLAPRRTRLEQESIGGRMGPCEVHQTLGVIDVLPGPVRARGAALGTDRTIALVILASGENEL